MLSSLQLFRFLTCHLPQRVVSKDKAELERQLAELRREAFHVSDRSQGTSTAEVLALQERLAAARAAQRRAEEDEVASRRKLAELSEMVKLWCRGLWSGGGVREVLVWWVWVWAKVLEQLLE